MEEYQAVESFISAVAEYKNDPSEAMTLVLEQHIHKIFNIGLSMIDDSSCPAIKFYACLYELMNLLSSTSGLMHHVLMVLGRAYADKAFVKQGLTHIDKLAPILIRLLETNITGDTRLTVLELLETLTDRSKLSWSQAQQSYIISVLIHQVIKSKDPPIVAKSLQTLLNVCSKNQSGVSMLTCMADVNFFIKTLFRNCPDDPATIIQCCHLMVLIKNIRPTSFTGGIPEFMTIISKHFIKALNDCDHNLLRYIVNFFTAASEIEHSKATIMNYENYAADVDTILTFMANDMYRSGEFSVLKFLLLLVSLKIPSVIPLYPRCVEFAMRVLSRLLQENYVLLEALALIRAIVIDSLMNPSSIQAYADLDLSALMLVANWRESRTNYNEEQNAGMQKTLTELMRLLQEMARIPNLKHKVIETFEVQLMRKLLKPMFEENNLSEADERPEISFHDPATSFCFHALALTADLAEDDTAWSTLYLEILQKKKIRMIMALALRIEDVEPRQKVLQLISSRSFPRECMFSVFLCLRDLNESTDKKLPIMRHKELATQARLEATDNHVPNSQHKLVEVVAESDKLQDLLDHNLKCLNDERSENRKISEVLQTAVAKIKTASTEKEKEIAPILDTILTTQLNIIEQRARQHTEYQKHNDRLLKTLRNIEHNTEQIIGIIPCSSAAYPAYELTDQS